MQRNDELDVEVMHAMRPIAIATAVALALSPVQVSPTGAADLEARLLRDVNKGPNGSAWQPLGQVDDRLFFVAGERGPRLYPRSFGMWVTDGTRRGTRRIHDPSDSWGDRGPRIDVLGEDDGALLFAKRAPSEPCEPEVWSPCRGFNPWRSDGTVEGTEPIVDEVGRLVGIGVDSGVVRVGDGFYFGGFHQDLGNALLRVESGTRVARVVIAYSPKFGRRWGKPKPLTALGDRLIFTVDDLKHGQELWVSDGTAEGTEILADIVPGKRSLSLDRGDGLDRRTTVIDERLFFQAFRGEEDPMGSWVTDGTPQGTMRLTDALLAFEPAPSEGPLVVAGEDETHGRELWATDGTEAGTMNLLDIAPGAAHGFSDHIFWDQAGRPLVGWLTDRAVGGRRFFIGDDGTHGSAPWVTDGTAAGTRMLAAIDPTSDPDVAPTLPVVSGGRVFFIADDGTNGRQIWYTDGEPDGTRMVGSIDLADRPLHDLTAVEGGVLFGLDEPRGRMSLWRTDGSDEGTTRIWRGRARGIGIDVVDGVPIFIAWRKPGRGTLWVTDGSLGGTTRVTGRKGRGLALEYSVGPVADELVFYADDGKHGLELWALPMPG